MPPLSPPLGDYNLLDLYGNPYVKAAQTIGKMFGFDPVGDVGDTLGKALGSLFGGGKRGVPLPGTSFAAKPPDWVERLGLPMDAVDARSYRNLTGHLEPYTKKTGAFADFVTKQSDLLGLTEVSKAIGEARHSLFGEVATDPQDAVHRIGNLMSIAGGAASLNDRVLQDVLSTPRYSQSLKNLSGGKVTAQSFVDQLRQDQNKFVLNNELGGLSGPIERVDNELYNFVNRNKMRRTRNDVARPRSFLEDWEKRLRAERDSLGNQASDLLGRINVAPIADISGIKDFASIFTQGIPGRGQRGGRGRKPDNNDNLSPGRGFFPRIKFPDPKFKQPEFGSYEGGGFNLSEQDEPPSLASGFTRKQPSKLDPDILQGIV